MDDYVTRFGIRTIGYNVAEGFLLNGEPTVLKGVCIHQDASPAGTAVGTDVLHRRLKILKEMGCNAIRTTHHPFSTEFYAMCDTMGFMVMDEPWDGWFQWKGSNKAKYDYGYYFLDWWERDLRDFIRRDRNYPCVVMWSMGNEVWNWESHQYLQLKINETYHQLDPTRPTTQAWALGNYLDIAGFNANGEGIGDLARFHRQQPEKVAVGTEIPHTRQTRGVYRTKTSYNGFDTPPAAGKSDVTSAGDPDVLFPIPDLTREEVFPEFDLRYASGYDNHTRKISCRDEWKQVRDNKFFIGDFRWTGFDYLGESWGCPARTNNYGVIDLAGFPKDSYYLYRSFWSDEPMVHILPHWTWPGKEGVEIPVVAYTNGDEAELFLDGRSLGRRKMDPEVLQIVWLVPYKAGTLKAVAYKEGRKVAETSVATASKPAAVRLSPDRKTMTANRRDVVHVEAEIVDARGRMVPYADNRIEFEITGPYRLIGMENGDILDWNPQQSLSGKAFMGKTLLMLQATGEAGVLTIKGKSGGLRTATATLRVENRSNNSGASGFRVNPVRKDDYETEKYHGGPAGPCVVCLRAGAAGGLQRTRRRDRYRKLDAYGLRIYGTSADRGRIAQAFHRHCARCGRSDQGQQAGRTFHVDGRGARSAVALVAGDDARTPETDGQSDCLRADRRQYHAFQRASRFRRE